jgi:uncharacterized membrane protein YkoI
MRKALSAALVVAAAIAPAFAAGQKTTVSEGKARATALAFVRGGTIRSSELEREHGRLVYSFDISRPHMGGVEEIQISATTGKLVSRHHETPAKEAAERQAEASEAKTKTR